MIKCVKMYLLPCPPGDGNIMSAPLLLCSTNLTARTVVSKSIWILYSKAAISLYV